VGASKLEQAIRREDAKAALIGLGWSATIARAAVAEALSTMSCDATLEQLIREALRRCPRPAATAEYRPQSRDRKL
jgi:Holliday junction resolvasome RuvABC DNA-binding subunit